jgi:preprotein translocase subunit SecG
VFSYDDICDLQDPGNEDEAASGKRSRRRRGTVAEMLAQFEEDRNSRDGRISKNKKDKANSDGNINADESININKETGNVSSHILIFIFFLLYFAYMLISQKHSDEKGKDDKKVSKESSTESDKPLTFREKEALKKKEKEDKKKAK